MNYDHLITPVAADWQRVIVQSKRVSEALKWIAGMGVTSYQLDDPLPTQGSYYHLQPDYDDGLAWCFLVSDASMATLLKLTWGGK